MPCTLEIIRLWTKSLRLQHATSDLNPGMSLIPFYDGCCSNNTISKAQYIRQFKKWAFEKNSNIDQWKAVTRVVRKRKFRGKDTEISIKGRRISDRKLRKEMSRYTVPNNDQECSSKKSRPALSDRRDNTSQRSDLLRP